MVLLRLLILFHSFVGLKGLAWPSGTYGIPESLSGCPDEEGVKWKTGWRRQHLEKKSQVPKSSHLNATLVLNGQGVERSFCIKTISKPDERNILWPAGKYCIYKYGESCPKGLKTGSFHWDDINDDNINDYGGVLPEGSYDNDTTIMYCCQDSGDLNQPIDLPFDKPFFLLPYKISICQHVKWTVRSLEKIVYDTEDDNNRDSSKGHHGYVMQKNSLATAYYCYYKACRKTLRNANGSFSSHSRSYQYCSWAIVVKEYFVISLIFSKLDIPDCQLNYLDIYEGLDDKSVLLARYCGSNATRPVSLNSARNTLFVVLKLGGNFDGLIMKHVNVKAEYSTTVNSKKCHETLLTKKNNGSFTSPMYPSENYPANQTCSWKVIVEENHFISLNFDYFYLPNCTNNYIKIYDGSNAMSPLLIQLCNEEIATRSTWNSTGNCVFIVYKSGESFGIDLQKRIGFSANFVKRKPCSLQGLSTKEITECLSLQKERSILKTTAKSSNENTSRKSLGVFNPRKKSSGSNKVTIIVTASLTSFFMLLLILLFVGLYIRRSSPFNGFLAKQRKESVNPIYEHTCESSSKNPMYSSTQVPIYEEPMVKKDFLFSGKKDPVRTEPKATEAHYETPRFG